MFNIAVQIRALFLTFTIVSSVIPPCFASPTDRQFSQTEQKQISQATELGKSNKLGKLAKSTQPAVIRIIAGCTAKVYWSDNKKTYEVTAGGAGSGYFVTANGYIVTNAHVTQLYQNKKQCLNELFESFVIQLAKDYNLSLDKLLQDKDALKYIAEHSQPQEFEQINLVILPNGDKLPFRAMSDDKP